MILPLTDKDFSDSFQLRTIGLILVYFKQSTCRACLMFDSIYQQLDQIPDDAIKAYNISFLDLTKFPMVLKKAENANIQINATPTLIIFNNGRALARIKDPLTIQNIVATMKSILNDVSPPSQMNYQYQDKKPNNFRKTNNEGVISLYTNDDYLIELNDWDYLTPRNTPWKAENRGRGSSKYL